MTLVEAVPLYQATKCQTHYKNIKCFNVKSCNVYKNTINLIHVMILNNIFCMILLNMLKFI